MQVSYVNMYNYLLYVAWEKQEVLQEKIFAEPRLVIFVSMVHLEAAQGFLVLEKTVLFQITNFSWGIPYEMPSTFIIQNLHLQKVFFFLYKKYF